LLIGLSSRKAGKQEKKMDLLLATRNAHKTREFREPEELLVRSAQDATRLSHMRYTGGVTGYLEVLTNENEHPPAHARGS